MAPIACFSCTLQRGAGDAFALGGLLSRKVSRAGTFRSWCRLFLEEEALRLKHTTLVVLWICAWALPVEGQRADRLPPTGTLSVRCRLGNAPHPRGTIYVNGQERGRCPGAVIRVVVGTHSVRVGEALGNNRYLVYENEQVQVRRDSTQSITASLARSTGEASPALAFALGVKRLSSIPFTDDFEVAAFSPDATTLAINGETNSVLLYDAASGRPLGRLGEKGEYWVSFVSALSFSADGGLLASNGWLTDKYVGEINIWDVKRGLLRRTIHGVQKVSALALSPDGRLLAAGVGPNTIKLWSVADGKLLRDIRPPGGDDGEVRPLFFSTDGRALISGQAGGDEIYVHDALTAEHRRTLPGRFATLADGGRLSTYLFAEGVAVRRTWRSPGGGLIESKKVRYRATDRMSESIVVDSSELWDARTGQLMVRLPGNYAVALSADGRRLLMHGDESGGGFAIWSLPAIPDVVAPDEQRPRFRPGGVICESPVDDLPDVGLKLKKKAVRLAVQPFEARRRSPGTVLVRVSVNREGRVECARILRGHPLFHWSVLNAAGGWEFAPMEVKGERVAYTGLLLIEFSGDGRVTFKK